MTGETILVVESEKNLVLLIRQELENEGYTVLVANTAYEVIDRFKKECEWGVIDGIILEHYNLPGLQETNGKLRQLLENVPVLGHTTDLSYWMDDATKPFSTVENGVQAVGKNSASAYELPRLVDKMIAEFRRDNKRDK